MSQAAFIGTLIPLPFETRALLGFSHIIRLTYLDLLQLTSASGQSVLPQNGLGLSANKFNIGSVVTKVLINVVTPFTSSGGAITTLTGSLGDSGSATRFINAADLKTAGYGNTPGSARCYSAVDSLVFTPTIVGQTMASLNAGQVDFYLKLEDASNLVNVVEPSAS